MAIVKVNSIEELGNEPGHYNRVKRMKYAAVAETLAEFEDAMSRKSMPVDSCPTVIYLRDHIDDDIIEVERFIFSHEDWGVPILCDGMIETTWYNNVLTPDGLLGAQLVQHDMMLALMEYHPFERARPVFCEMLKHPKLVWHSWEAAYCSLVYLTAGHPNPRRFLEKPEVRSKYPPELRVDLFPSPDFPLAVESWKGP